MEKRGFSVLPVVLLVGIVVALGAVVFGVLGKGGGKAPSLNLPGQTEVVEGRKFVALGASFTKANNLSSSLVGDNGEYSFATGTKIESIYLYLKNSGEKLNPVNLAESGADSKSVLQKQVSNAVSYQPKLVTIDIMVDIFTADTPADLRRNLTEIVRQVKGEDTTILLASYPNLTKMRTAAFPACQEDKLRIGVDRLTQEKIQTFNQMLREFAAESRLIFVDLYDVLGPAEVSDYDCLHPNIEGQKKLAKAWIEALKTGR